MKYQHLFFDLDHTLWDFETNSRETMVDVFVHNDLLGRGIPSFDLFFERYSYHNHRLWERYTKGFIKQDELRWKRMWLALLDFKLADEPLSKKMAVEFLEQLPLKQPFPLHGRNTNLPERKKLSHALSNQWIRKSAAS